MHLTVPILSLAGQNDTEKKTHFQKTSAYIFIVGPFNIVPHNSLILRKYFHSVSVNLIFQLSTTWVHTQASTMLSDWVTEGKETNTSDQPTAGKFKLRLWGLSTPPGSHADCCWGGLTSVQKLFSAGITVQMAGKEPNLGLQETGSSTTAPMCLLLINNCSTTYSFHTTNDHNKICSDRKSYNM